MISKFLAAVGLAILVYIPLSMLVGDYHLHLMIQILLWAAIYTGWAIMGRFGLVSLGHGAFMGIGAYTTVLLWNEFGISPLLGIPIAIVLAVLVAAIVAIPCFRFRIIGHYFALVTLALSEVVRLIIVALREHTGGSLGITPLRHADVSPLLSFQFSDKASFYFVALLFWVFTLLIWHLVDRSMARPAMMAIADDEDATASIGINVTWQKLRVTLISAALTAFGGALYGQYQMYINPDTVSGIAVSLQIVFAVVAGGMFVQFGPTVGALFTLMLAESLRVLIGNEYHGADTTIYGLMLILFIIYMPKGILGAILARFAPAKTAKFPDSKPGGAESSTAR
ncbi:MAG: branched-chain amino acid ABC transporter permease [Candidatus Competibacteraceae bacterium]|nr:branched-chain amino acid ABC transporter permease [Candidatus Competibacteraceae bacterium]